MIFKSLNAFFSPIHFFQPFAELAYLLAYFSLIEGSFSIHFLIMSCRRVLASMAMSFSAIIWFNCASVWYLCVRPG